MLQNLLSTTLFPHKRRAAAAISGLPDYQVALWPDGWELMRDGSVLVLGTHAMAEARRWYLLADRNRAREDGRRAMALHRIFVPRPIVGLVNRCFASELAASVAVRLVAGEWISQRRRQLAQAPECALWERSLSWRGSRHELEMDSEQVEDLVRALALTCAREHLIPDADYRPRVRAEDGFGIRSYRCEISVRLDPHAAASALEILTAALIPWNRAVVRNGRAARLIEIERGSNLGPYSGCPGDSRRGS